MTIMTDDTKARIDSVVNGSDVLLFMKGTPLFPQCGFSSRAIAILDHLGVEYGTVDVLQDPACVRLMTQFIARNPALWNEDIGV